MSVLPVLITLLILGGDIPDPDRNAHDMWANQLINTSRLIISEQGTYDDWQLYYPNTVPKPLELFIGIIRAPGGVFFHSAIILLSALLVLAATWYSAGRGRTGLEAAFFLGFNPVFVFLCVRGNSAIPFLGAMFLLQSVKTSNAGAVIASLARPEGFIYSGYHCIRNRKWKLLALLGTIGIAWLAFHKVTCGSFTWTADEVKFSVAAMDYPTANPVTFFPWAGLRSILILGAPAAALLLLSFRRWKQKIPFSLNFLLLAVSLAMGSLVLPRYIDQLFLIAAPFIFLEINRIFKGKTRTTVAIAAIVFPSFQWISTIPEISQYERLRETYRSFELPEEGITAANELLIPGFCLNLGIDNPTGRFISVDKAAWSHASEAELKEYGVTQVVIVPAGVYFPPHTEEWLETIKDIEVKYFR
ncbi:MAG: hypothetical protein K8S62_00850 [Candidatus Sabulitectum sp.]|nr:hypothetical protein [Candidatus Sabulitectum sp.]